MLTYSNANIRTWARLGMRGAAFAVAMPEIAEENENVKLLTADLELLSGMDRYVELYPDKFLNVGIAEQNMIGIAAGLAMEGVQTFATTYASFIAVRSLEHVRQHVSHMRLNVKLIGTAAGCIQAKSGVSHWATEDLAFTRVLPHVLVFSPADAIETVKIMLYAASIPDPVYIRLSGKTSCPLVYKEDYDWQPGKFGILRTGSDAAILATGLMVKESLDAAELLAERGISCSVMDVHTISPIDEEGIRKAFSSHRLVATVEEHNIKGGMGSAVAEVRATLRGDLARQCFIGFEDHDAAAGTQRFVWEQTGLTAERIADRIEQELAAG